MCSSDLLLGAEDSGQNCQPWIWDAYNADIRLDCGKGVIRSKNIVLGEGVKEGRLSDIGQTDDSNREAHEEKSLTAKCRW